jgi:hypothetical protein
MTNPVDAGWSVREFRGLDLGDERLNRRLFIMAEAFGVQPEAPINRQTPEATCTTILADHEWKALYTTIHRTTILPNTVPSVRQAVRWIPNWADFWAGKAMVNLTLPPSGAVGHA